MATGTRTRARTRARTRTRARYASRSDGCYAENQSFSTVVGGVAKSGNEGSQIVYIDLSGPSHAVDLCLDESTHSCDIPLINPHTQPLISNTPSHPPSLTHPLPILSLTPSHPLTHPLSPTPSHPLNTGHSQPPTRRRPRRRRQQHRHRQPPWNPFLRRGQQQSHILLIVIVIITKQTGPTVAVDVDEEDDGSTIVACPYYR